LVTSPTWLRRLRYAIGRIGFVSFGLLCNVFGFPYLLWLFVCFLCVILILQEPSLSDIVNVEEILKTGLLDNEEVVKKLLEFLPGTLLNHCPFILRSLLRGLAVDSRKLARQSELSTIQGSREKFQSSAQKRRTGLHCDVVWTRC
jgi:hypothetical protein